MDILRRSAKNTYLDRVINNNIEGPMGIKGSVTRLAEGRAINMVWKSFMDDGSKVTKRQYPN